MLSTDLYQKLVVVQQRDQDEDEQEDSLCAIHVEVRQRLESNMSRDELQTHVRKYLHMMGRSTERKITEFPFSSVLEAHVEEISLEHSNADDEEDEDAIDHIIFDLGNSELGVYIYKIDLNKGPFDDFEENDDGEQMPSQARQWMLPSASLQDLWDNLIYDSTVKSDLLQYALTFMFFSERGVNTNIVACNRVILLHGPPGTGKTSLCHAVAQKLSIRLSSVYRMGTLVEINSHSLFSKYFSESPQLVQKIFEKIEDLVADENMFVCLLIDEVESLATNREKSSNSDPGDAVRVVNALLTRIDRLKNHDNILILTTSNIVGSIDLAFVDRADIKIQIGLPSPSSRAKIIEGGLQELIAKGIVIDEPRRSKHRQLFHDIIEKTEGHSARTLKKLPVLAHAFFVKGQVTTYGSFLWALSMAADRQNIERQVFL